MSHNTDRTFNPGAAILAWLWPGLGHISLGHVKRGVLIMAGVLLLFGGGVLIGGIDSVDWRDDTLWFYAQAGNGPIAFGVDELNKRYIETGRVGSLMWSGGVIRPVPDASGIVRFPAGTVNEYTGLAHVNEYATLMSALAGLMNVAVILDALTRPRATRPHSERRQPA